MERFGRFEILDTLGQGTVTTVHRARDTHSQEQIALKLFRLEFAPGSTEARAWQERFLRETAAAGRLTHPNIVRLLDAGLLEGRPWVATEYVEGKTLAELLRAGALDLGRKLEVAIDIADALVAAHAARVLHQSLRPANVFLDREGQVRVSDFGGLDLLAEGASQSSDAPVPERMHYRAPEEIYRQRPDERTDIFALGIVLYEMAFRRRPFDGDSWFQVTQRILNVPPPYLRESSGELPIALVKILDRALAKSPLDRYATAAALKRDLLEVRDNLRQASTGDRSAEGSRKLEDEPTTGIALASLASEAHLVLEDGDERRAIPLTAESFTIGRRSENKLIFGDDSVSRYHLKIVPAGKGFELQDRRSRHGTWVNGEKVVKAHALQHGDRLELGHYRRGRLVFRLGPPELEPPPIEPAYRDRDLQLLLEVVKALNSSLDLDKVLNLIVDSALEFTASERGFILLRDPRGEFSVRLGRYQNAKDLTPGEETVSMSVVQRCVDLEKPVLVHDAGTDSQFGQKDSVHDLHLKWILCLPLLSRGVLRGVLYLDSRERRKPLEAARLRLLQAFAEHAAVAVENARLYEMAIVDPLTGLFRRDYFFHRLKEEMQRAHRNHAPLALLFADLDHFKAVNDTWGHPAGDEVLRAIGGLLKELARNTDVAARYGGEELVILMPQTDLEEALRAAERLLTGARRIRLPLPGGGELKVTLSLGAAAWPGPGVETPDDLVRAADDALLAAKKTGRDRAVAAGA